MTREIFMPECLCSEVFLHITSSEYLALKQTSLCVVAGLHSLWSCWLSPFPAALADNAVAHGAVAVGSEVGARGLAGVPARDDHLRAADRHLTGRTIAQLCTFGERHALAHRNGV